MLLVAGAVAIVAGGFSFGYRRRFMRDR